MINSVLKNLQKLKECNHETMHNLVEKLDAQLLEPLRDFLGECYELRKFLSVQAEPSFCRVMVVRATLEKVAEKMLVGVLAPIKPHFDSCLGKFKFSSTHLAATFLWPYYKDNNKIFSNLQKEEAKDRVVELHAHLQSQGLVNSPSVTTPMHLQYKRPKCVVNLLDDTDDLYDDFHSDSSISDEINKYSSMFLDKKAKFQNVLEFWHDYSSSFPNLAAVAMFLHAIPATNNATERLFSKCRLTLTHTRTALGLDRFNKLTVMNSNSDLCEEMQEINFLFSQLPSTENIEDGSLVEEDFSGDFSLDF